MSDITKPVTKHIGASQYWDTSTDLDDAAGSINAGDIFRIEKSLGKPAANMTITTGAGAVSIRINAMQTLYPARKSNEFFNADYMNNISVGVEYKDTSQAPIVVAASQTWEWKGEVPIKNIEIVSMAANFKLQVS